MEKEKYSSISETTLDNMSKVFLPLIQEDLVSAQDYFKELSLDKIKELFFK